MGSSLLRVSMSFRRPTLLKISSPPPATLQTIPNSIDEVNHDKSNINIDINNNNDINNDNAEDGSMVDNEEIAYNDHDEKSFDSDDDNNGNILSAIGQE